MSQFAQEDSVNEKQTRMVAFRAALVALILATTVATFLGLAILARRSLEHSDDIDRGAGVISESAGSTKTEGTVVRLAT